MAATLRRMFLLLLCGANMTRGLRRRRNLEPIGADDWGDAKLSSVIRNILDGSRGAEPGRGGSLLTTFGADDGRVSGGNSVRPSEDYQAIVRDVEDALNAGDSRRIRSDDAEPRTIVVKRRSHRREKSNFIEQSTVNYHPPSSAVVEEVDEVLSLVADYIDLEREVGDKLERYVEDLAAATKSGLSLSVADPQKVHLSAENLQQFADDYEQLGEDLRDDRDILSKVRRYLELLSEDPRSHRSLQKLLKPLDRLVRNTHALQDVHRELRPVVEGLQRNDVPATSLSFDEVEVTDRLRSIDHVYSDLSSGFDSLAYSVIVSAI
ncbi:hypothetical protein FOZ61_003808 [Perkinsus olseni]|uniref:Uncharacterized protein n=1 Tax=Perkinsus olseni TaxID=32597 RepID=A0A7J6LNI0_PEROL|nr:hypothetical protein FOZ61_003808 [Perkinsus olseni]KAF4665838.1 hypothetical protein FOL46_003452 [Perkinsus olseni]